MQGLHDRDDVPRVDKSLCLQNCPSNWKPAGVVGSSLDGFAARSGLAPPTPPEAAHVPQDGFWMGNIFRGYSTMTLAVVANLAFSGLLVSWVMKFADSIMKARTGGLAEIAQFTCMQSPASRCHGQPCL